MVEYWGENGSSGVKSVASDSMTLALHVITFAGFGISYTFKSGLYGMSKEGPSNYRDALADVMNNVVLLALLPRWMYGMPFLPKSIAKFCNNVRSFKKYMVNMVQAEKEQSSHRTPVEANILSTLVMKSEESRLGLDEGQPDSKEPLPSRKGLTDEELYGNIFMFSFAGHETTAHTITYAICLFVANPEWQEWVAEEVGHVFGQLRSYDLLDYDELYPRLKRCLAVMVS